MKHTFKRVLSWMIVLCMVLSFVPAVRASGVSWKEIDMELALDRSDRLVQKDDAADHDENEIVRVSIVLEEPSTVEAGYATMGIAGNQEAMTYRAQLQASQERMEKTISHKVLNGRPLDVVWNMTLVGNIISAWVPYGSLEQIAALPGVETVAMEAQYEPSVAERVEGVQPNAYPSSGMVGSTALWNSGYTGAGTRIAIIDTGTDTDHQSFDNGAYLHALAENAEAKGMSEEQYLASLDLLTVKEIAEVLPKMNLHQMDANVTAEQLYMNEKLAFGYNYVDRTLNIVHDYDQQGEHGSHVAGISTANRYIPQGSGYAKAADTVLMQGVAPDAQLITMKVFGESSPFDSDYMAAIEDAILLGCDTVNLSMGTTAPGSPYTDVYSELMEMMTKTDTVVVISAGNAANWAVASLHGYLYNDDVSFDTVGAPGSYGSAFTVASVENSGTVGNYFEVSGSRYFYAETTGYGNTAFTTLDTSADQSGTVYEYVFLDGLGYEEEYEGIDVAGKVVFVQRGTLNFAVKANNALSRGAAAVAVYNNQEGVSNMDLSGLSYAAPVFSVTQADGAAIRAASVDKGTHLTGKLTVYGKQGVGQSDSEYYTMSDFSSWGVPGDLTLKPEITAPGGMIYSVWGSNAVTGGGSDQYEMMSGTSMAAPQVTGLAALLAQYYQENGMAEKTGLSARHLAQSLLMSTAVPMYEEASGGYYYSLLNQGAGLARVDLAASADSFIKVEGQDDYKVKAELGDDPQRTGIYEFDFTITNMTDSEKVYALDADLFRQDVFEYQPDSDVWLLDTWTTNLEAAVTFTSDRMSGTAELKCDLNGDGVTNAADADYLTEYVVGNVSDLKAEGDISGDGQINSYDAHLLLASLKGDTITVPANGSADVQVRMELTEAAKAELDAETPKGTYVEAYVYVRGVADAEGSEGTVHSIPVLAFYGDWSEPSMFDRGTLMDLVHLTSNVAPYLYRVIGPYGNALGIDYGDGNEYYYGGNPILTDATYLPERDAFNSEDASVLTEQTFTLIRGAGDARIQILNAETNEIYFERRLGELLPAYYNTGYGAWEATNHYARLDWSGKDASGKALAEGTKVAVKLTAAPYYYRQENGSYPFDELGEGCTLTSTFTIDNTAPEVLDMDDTQVRNGKLTITAQDNEYVAAVALLNSKGTKILAGDTPNQTEKNAKVTVELDISTVMGQKFLVAVFDYANNMRTYEVTLELPEIEREYFTGVNTNTGAYVTMDIEGNMTELTTLDIPTQVRAGEYVGGYVFTITSDNMLCVAKDADLTDTTLIGPIDPKNEWLLDSVADMAYNYQDGQMYLLFYSGLNGSWVPYLATLDLGDGSLNVLCEMPVDVQTLAIDGEGNCYSAGFDSPSLYTYTVEEAMNGVATYVGEMGYFGTQNACCMAWDHNTDELYFSYPTTLLKVDPKTAEPTVLCYFTAQLLGLYIRPEGEPTDKFDPIDQVDRIELNLTDTRVMMGEILALEATVWPWNVSDKGLTWTSSDESVATVDANGAVTAKGLGECVITATSNLDPTVTAQCAIETFQLEKTLNGLVWDEEGKIWMSEFSTAKLPEYTKLHDKYLEESLAAATVGQDGRIYAASLNMEDLTSSLYVLDPTTFQPDKIGDGIPTSDALNPTGYVDLAPAPGQGTDKLMGIWGGNVLNVDASTGGYYNHYYMFSNNLVALAYVGTDLNYTEWGFDTQVDWYFIIDRLGYVYLMGFLEQDGSYYYLEHDTLAPQGVYTVLNFEMETPYFGSAYFDGEMLYYSAYKESRDNVTLMAIDVAGGSKACYTLGTFDTGVWPVAGLMELGKEVENHVDLILNAQSLQTMAQPKPVEEQTELKGIRDSKAEGSLNNAAVPMSSGEVKDDLVYVDVTLPYADTNADMTVTFDTAKLELTEVSGNTTAFAWNAKDGKIDMSLAEAGVISENETVARLTFRAVGRGETTISILTGGLGSEGCGHDEILTVDLPANNPFVDVPEWQFYYEPVMWAVDNGITNGISETIFNPNGICSRDQIVTFLWRAMGEPEPTIDNPFADVAEGTFYYKPVLWAYEKGITKGVDAAHFNPTGMCNRSEVVTFLWRTMGEPASDETITFTDVKAGMFYTEAVAWAVENGITNGLGDGTFGTLKGCTRGEVVTFLYRTLNK